MIASERDRNVSGPKMSTDFNLIAIDDAKVWKLFRILFGPDEVSR